MTQLLLSEISKIIGASTTRYCSEDLTITRFSIDTRKILSGKQTLFFALKGLKKDGHDFIPQAYELGVNVFVVDEGYLIDPSFSDACFLTVKDVLHSLQTLATHYRNSLKKTQFVGITGSNGKTIVKDWLFQLLNYNVKTGKSPGSFNSKIGVPLSILAIEKDHKIALIEAGISTTGEMDVLCDIIRPNIGIFTSLGTAHEAGFSSENEKLQEKIKLFATCEIIIYNRDAEKVHEAISTIFPNHKIYTWGKHKQADLQISKLDISDTYTDVEYTVSGQKHNIRLSFVDAASIENALSCLSFLYFANIEERSQLIQHFGHLKPLKNRLELKNGLYNSLILNDSYSADLSGLSAAYTYFSSKNKNRDKTLILSDFSGYETIESHQILVENIAQIINTNPVNQLILIGKRILEIVPHLNPKIKVFTFPTLEHFFSDYDKKLLSYHLILVKGSRLFDFSKIVKELSEQRHRSELEINLSALTNNLNSYASTLPQSTKVLVMVKAAAYGAGSIEIAGWLQNQQIDYLGVAFPDEGVELRVNGIQLPIMVLNVDNQSFDRIVEHRLEPEIFSLHQLNQFIQFLLERDIESFPIHLKVETGMNRLGFQIEEQNDLIELLKTHKNQIKIASVFTHLAASDDQNEDGYTHFQAQKFTAFYKKLESAIGYAPLRHILNTSGIVRFPEYTFDMIRLGIGIYGLIPDQHLKIPLQHALTLRSVVSHIKSLEIGETVSYGRTWKAERKSVIATVAIGYADGLRRDAGKKNIALKIRDQYAPIIGNVCMDMCLVDITDLDGVKTGDEAIVFSPDFPITIVAKKLETIPYEVITSIAQRVTRIYTSE